MGQHLTGMGIQHDRMGPEMAVERTQIADRETGIARFGTQ